MVKFSSEQNLISSIPNPCVAQALDPSVLAALAALPALPALPALTALTALPAFAALENSRNLSEPSDSNLNVQQIYLQNEQAYDNGEKHTLIIC